MNIGKILQIIGIVLFAIGFLAKIGAKLFLETDFSAYSESFQMLKFAGFVSWGVGFVILETTKKRGKKIPSKKTPSKV